MATGKRVACIYSSSDTSYDKHNNNGITTESNYVSNRTGETLFYHNNLKKTHSVLVDKASPVNSAQYNYQESESEVESALPVTLYAPRERHIAYEIHCSGVKYINNNNTTEFSNGEVKEDFCCSSLPSDLLNDEMSLPYSWSSKYEYETVSATRARWLRDNTFGPVVLSEIAESEELSHSHDCNFDSCNNNNSKESPLSYSTTNSNNSTFATPMKKKHCKANKITNVISNDDKNDDKEHKIVNVNLKTHKRVNNTVETRRWAQNVWDYITHPVHEHSAKANSAKAIESSTGSNTTAKIMSLEHINERTEERREQQQEWGKTCTAWPTSHKANDRIAYQNNKVKIEINNNDNEIKTIKCNANTKNNILHYKSSSMSSLYPYNYENIESNITASRQPMANQHNEHLHKQQVEHEKVNEKGKNYTDKYKQWYQLCKKVTTQSNRAKENLDNQSNKATYNTNSLPVRSLEVLSPSAEADHESQTLCTRPSFPCASSTESSSNQFFLDDTSTVVGCIPRRCNRLIKRHVSYGLLDTNSMITMENVNGASSECMEENIKGEEEEWRNVANSNRSVNSDVVNQQEYANTTSSYNAIISESCRVVDNSDCNDKVVNVVVEHSTNTKSNTPLKGAENKEKLHNCKVLKQCTPLANKSVNTIEEPCANYKNTTAYCGNSEASHQLCQHHDNIMPIHKSISTNKSLVSTRITNNSVIRNVKETSTTAVNGRGRELRALFVNDDDDNDDDDCDECVDLYTFYHTDINGQRKT